MKPRNCLVGLDPRNAAVSSIPYDFELWKRSTRALGRLSLDEQSLRSRRRQPRLFPVTISRRWVALGIRSGKPRAGDAFAASRELPIVVRGPGVVGEQPTIEPGQSFRYTSGCPLTTPSGLLVGEYRMVDPEGRRFEVSIPAFSLDFPGGKRVLN